jgi:4-hydroxy-tetrahydrodipicolinate synthase
MTERDSDVTLVARRSALPSNSDDMPSSACRCFAISITPFDEHGQIDETKLRGHFDYLADGGVGVYVAGGASGEAFTFTEAENRLVLRAAAEQLKGKVPVRGMGIEPRSAAQMINFADFCAEAGLDAVQVYSLDQGHGLRPTEQEMLRYYTDVLSNISVPAVLSSHHLSGYTIPLPVILKLLDQFPGFIGLNVSTPDINYVIRVIEAVRGRAEVHVGGIQAAPAALMLGGNGFLSSQANLAPRLSQSVCDYYAAGDLAGMSKAFATVLRLLVADSGFGNVRGVKEALNQLGLHGGYVRPPRMPVDDATKPAVTQMLLDLDIRGVEQQLSG